ncbi:MAG: archease [Bacteroidota bacterium]
MTPAYEILEHPSDLGIEAHGNTREEMYSNAALGLIFVIAGTSKIESLVERTMTIPAIDRENLLVRWLTEVLFLYDAEKFLTAAIEFEVLNDTLLKAKILGEPFNARKHKLRLDIKAITYHQLKIEEHSGIWTARVFVDI